MLVAQAAQAAKQCAQRAGRRAPHELVETMPARQQRAERMLCEAKAKRSEGLGYEAERAARAQHARARRACEQVRWHRVAQSDTA